MHTSQRSRLHSASPRNSQPRPAPLPRHSSLESSPAPNAPAAAAQSPDPRSQPSGSPAEPHPPQKPLSPRSTTAARSAAEPPAAPLAVRTAAAQTAEAQSAPPGTATVSSSPSRPLWSPPAGRGHQNRASCFHRHSCSRRLIMLGTMQRTQFYRRPLYLRRSIAKRPRRRRRTCHRLGDLRPRHRLPRLNIQCFNLLTSSPRLQGVAPHRPPPPRTMQIFARQ